MLRDNEAGRLNGRPASLIVGISLGSPGTIEVGSDAAGERAESSVRRCGRDLRP
jgi:hypothetical protein